jgi:hypothetical protein
MVKETRPLKILATSTDWSPLLKKNCCLTKVPENLMITKLLRISQNSWKFRKKASLFSGQVHAH